MLFKKMYTNLNLKDFSFEMHGFNDTLGDNTFIVIQFNQFKDSNTKINTECLKKTFTVWILVTEGTILVQFLQSRCYWKAISVITRCTFNVSVFFGTTKRF